MSDPKQTYVCFITYLKRHKPVLYFRAIGPRDAPRCHTTRDINYASKLTKSDWEYVFANVKRIPCDTAPAYSKRKLVRNLELLHTDDKL